MKKLLFLLPLFFNYYAISQVITLTGNNTTGESSVGTRENVASYGSGEYTYKRGKIFNKDGEEVNGFYVRGEEIGRTSNGFIRYGNNKIFISKNSVKKMWTDENYASKVLFHYHWICNKLYTGEADSIARLHGNDAAKILLEIGAHQFIQDYFKSDESYWIRHYQEKLLQINKHIE